jgi:hypothetical protein
MNIITISISGEQNNVERVVRELRSLLEVQIEQTEPGDNGIIRKELIVNRNTSLVNRIEINVSGLPLEL